MLLGALFCFVGALIPLTLFLFTAHTYAIENKRYAQALGRSRRLADGVGGTVFAALLILWAISAVVSLGISLPLAYGFDILLHIAPDSNMLFSSSVGHNGDAQRQALAQVSDAISSLLLTPFVFSVVTVLYYDLRIRKEAFDVVLLAQGLDYPPLAALSGYLPPAYAPPPAGKERERQ